MAYKPTPLQPFCKPPPGFYNCALRIVLYCTVVATTASEAPATGNFGISSDCWFSNIVYNPSAYSTYLAEAGRGATLEVSVDGSPPRPLSAIFSASPPSVFPECSFTATLSPGVQLRWRAFAPLSPEDAELGFLPLLLGTLTLDVSPTAPRYSRNVTLLYRFYCGSDEGARAACSAGGSGAGYVWLPQPLQGAANFSAGPLFVGAAGGFAAGAHCGGLPSDRALALCAQLTVVSEPGGGSSLGLESGVLFVGYHVPVGRYASAFPTPLSLAVYGASSVPLLAAHHAAFIAAIPSTGSPTIDAGMRAWLQAPILLTKGVGARALTMGYVELNARDSFWTTAGLHALLWPSLEALMLRESCEFACSPGGGPPSYCRAADHGKIPTCVLPTIVRDDNVDITAFWALRVGRYLAATGDAATLDELYPCLRAALLYLQRRAAPGEALPAAREDSYWGSWLDVPFMKGRKLIADNSAVYLAAQRVGATAAALLLASRGGAATNATRADVLNFSAAYAAGWRQLTASASEGGGGQWDVASGSLRDTRWDGRASNYSLGDQFMAVYFNLLGAPRAQSLLAWVTAPGASGLEGPFGIRALFPYEPHAADPWGGEYDAGVYANGGSYAWLTCGTVLALAAAGDTAGAWRVWLKLTTRMFEPGAGGLAYEYLHSDTGARMGHAPQGWDGVCAAWAWQGGAVRWWRESPVADVGPRGGATGAADPSEVDPGAAAAPQSHTYHLVLPVLPVLPVPQQQLGSGGEQSASRLPLLLPLLSVPSRRCFLRCNVRRGSAESGQRWDASSAACDVVSGIMAGTAVPVTDGGKTGPATGAGGNSVVWRDVSPCVRQASGFQCDVSGPAPSEAATVHILLS